MKKVWALAILCVTLTSCSQELVIEVSVVNRETVLTFKHKPFLFAARPVVSCVQFAGVTDETTGREVWALRARSNKCVEASHLVIESPPPGLDVTTNQLPLAVGHSFHATVIS